VKPPFQLTPEILHAVSRIEPKNRNDFEQEGTEVTEDQSFEAGIEAHSISPLE
jgi:hypothetical protein